MPTLRARKDARFTNLDEAALNGGVPPATWAGEYFTPPAQIFTRSHAPIPEIDPASWRLTVHGLVDRPLELSLAELEVAAPIREVSATLICAGMRRQEFLDVAPLGGELPWAGQPVANLRWRGVSLIDVLAAAGIRPECRHVVFSGLDQVERQGRHFGFGGSIPIHKARDRDVLLAFALDGQPLPPVHGFPVRAVVPGWIGARSVKWLAGIELTDVPSTNYFRTRAYRVQRVVNPDDPHDVSAGDPLEEICLNSMIVTPEPGTHLRAGVVDVSGWAIGPGAEPPARVEVSPDGGATWAAARLEPAADRWSWRIWTAALRLAAGSHDLVVRAWDQAGRTQPPAVADVWNVKGYVNNAWHRVTIHLADG